MSAIKSNSLTLTKNKQKTLYADIVFNHPLNRHFTYSTPENLTGKIAFGKRVIVPFGMRKKDQVGYIIHIHDSKPSFVCKDVTEVLDEYPIFNEAIYDLAKWISNYYICSIGESLSLFIPKETKEKKYILKETPKKELLLLNSEQNHAVQIISNSIKNKEYKAYLLFGVTGSGKTEVYKHLCKKVISKGKQALILVPEIALTPQTIHRFQGTFGNKIAVLHSKLNPKERYYNWKLIQNNEADIILGARSAIFSPINRLGIIIIDEEHESSYKAGDTPRYHTRQIAFKLGQTKNIPVVLGSATPSLETMYHSEHNTLTLLSLIERHSKHKQQTMTLVDMRKEKSKSFIGKTLFGKISDCLSKKEQVMIFLNKRGYSPLLICKDCGHTMKCPNCDISLTYHQSKEIMLCHYCDYSSPVSGVCPGCEGDDISIIGYGTERIEEELSENFINANIARMDLDTTRKKNAHEKILTAFKKKEIDILIGTQMIAKGLHFPNVTLVGVVLADLSLHIPDFRASEKTFSLLTQVSGRAGRGVLEGEVVIQTYLPDHYVIQSALKQDYNLFYQTEIEERKKYSYPPFSRFVKLLLRGKKEEVVAEKMQQLSEFLRASNKNKIEILGPVPAPLSKINNNYRWQILLKGKNISFLQALSLKAKDFLKKENSLYLEIDIDPLSMM